MTCQHVDTLAKQSLGIVSRALRLAYASLCLAVAIMLTLTLVYFQMTATQMLKEDRVSLERHLEGTASKPFTYRVLIPVSIQLLVSITPESLIRAIEHRVEPVGKKLVPDNMPATSRPIYYYYLALILVGSLFLYGLVSLRLFEALFGWHRVLSPLIPVITLSVLFPFQSDKIAHLYDYTVLLFMSGLLYAMATERHRMFLLLFAVSCFNKETTILITFCYVYYFFDRLPRPRFVAFVSIQLLLFICIYGGLRYHFDTNPGESMEHYWKLHFGWLVSRPFSGWASSVLYLSLISYSWRGKPVLLRRSAVILVPHTVLFIFGGYPGELRAFYESLPLLTMFICRNLELLSRDWILREVPLEKNYRKV
jgi:hypothetical protein